MARRARASYIQYVQCVGYGGRRLYILYLVRVVHDVFAVPVQRRTDYTAVGFFFLKPEKNQIVTWCRFLFFSSQNHFFRQQQQREDYCSNLAPSHESQGRTAYTQAGIQPATHTHYSGRTYQSREQSPSNHGDFLRVFV